MSTLQEQSDQVTPVVGGGVRMLPVGRALWRVVDRGERALGHIEAHAEAAGLRYRASRFHAPSRAFMEVGDFWSAADAVECLRISR